MSEEYIAIGSTDGRGKVSSSIKNRSALTPHDAVRFHEVSVAAASSREARKCDGHSVYAGEGKFEPTNYFIFRKRDRGRYFLFIRPEPRTDIQ